MGKNKSSKSKSKEAPNDQIVLHPSGIPITQNAFQNLQDFPPITFAQATEKPSQISPSKTPEYLKKDFEEPITLLSFSNVPTKGDIQTFLSRFLPPNFNWIPEDPRKDLSFYRQILAESNSCKIDDKIAKDTNFSKCLIFQIIISSDWGNSPWSYRPLSKPCNNLTGYNYYDYVHAWHRVFLVESYNHSWFISFHPVCLKNNPRFPVWFLEWWRKYGLEPSLLPEELKKPFQYFCSKTARSSQWQMINIMDFCKIFRLAWISCWSYCWFQRNQNEPYTLHRQFNVKWWKNFTIFPGFLQLVSDYCSMGEKALQRYSDWSKEQELKKRSPTVQAQTQPIPVPVHPQVPNPSFDIAGPSTPSKDKNKQSISKQKKSITPDSALFDEFLEFKKFVKARSSAEATEKSSSSSSSEGSSCIGPFSQDPYDF